MKISKTRKGELLSGCRGQRPFHWLRQLIGCFWHQKQTMASLVLLFASPCKWYSVGRRQFPVAPSQSYVLIISSPLIKNPTPWSRIVLAFPHHVWHGEELASKALLTQTPRTIQNSVAWALWFGPYMYLPNASIKLTATSNVMCTFVESS